MKKILINAYACCPNIGSEQGMAWNFISYIAKSCECFVITECEYKTEILKMLDGCGLDTAHFYFVPVGEDEDESARIRQKCWHQGTWSFYMYYAQWQKKILPIAEKIIEEYGIDIMHQLNMVGFREPGMLYKINERREARGLQRIPLIWGPSAGFGSIPFSFMTGGGAKFTAFYLLKNFLNKVQMKWHPRVRRMVKESNVLIAATPDMKEGFLKYYEKDVELINETGTFLDSLVLGNEKVELRDERLERKKSFKLLWVGRFLYTKQLPLALVTMAKIRCLGNVELHIVGKGASDEETEKMYRKAEELGISDIVHWHGFIPNAEVQQLMRECDVFFFTSIFEATSTVILEAITNNLPIVCFDRCGFGPIVDEKIGRKIPCVNPKQAVEGFAKEIAYLYNHPEDLAVMSANCNEKKVALSWEMKIKRLMKIYNSL